MDAKQNKARTMKIIRVWCEKCRASMKIVTPRDKEAKYCPCCKGELTVESIRYV